MTRPLIVARPALVPGDLDATRALLADMAAAGADLVEMDVRVGLNRRPFVVHGARVGQWPRDHGRIRLRPSLALGRLPLRRGVDEEPVAPLGDILSIVPEGLQPALHLRHRGALRQVLRTIERHGAAGRTWLWLEHHVDVFTATRRLPELRCTLLRPAGWTATARQAYFLDAQRSGAHGVSVPWGVISPELIQLARQHRLTVFSRLERLDMAPALVAGGLGGIITTDPAGLIATIGSGTPGR